MARKPEASLKKTAAELLYEAVHVPGVVSDAYNLFRDYSISNKMLIMTQCAIKNIDCGPVGTYKFWKEHGRKVVSGKGSGLFMWMPTTYHKKDKDGEPLVNSKGEPVMGMGFKLKPYWFVLSQTEGDDYIPPEIPGWDLGDALVKLEVEPEPFTMPDGNCMGYATSERHIAINPLGTHQEATTMHELAHIVLGHTEEGMLIDESSRTPRSIKEAEAEATAMIVLEALGYEDHAESRGYIQNWLGKGNEIPEESAKRIFKAAETIIQAGRNTNGTHV